MDLVAVLRILVTVSSNFVAVSMNLVAVTRILLILWKILVAVSYLSLWATVAGIDFYLVALAFGAPCNL